MNSIQRLFPAFLMLIMALPVFSQDHQLLIFNSGLPASTMIQPAHLAPLAEGATRVGIDLGTRFHSTAIPYSWLTQEDNFLDETEKSSIVDAINGREDLWTDFSGQIQIQRNIKGHRLSIGYLQDVDAKASLEGNDMVRLALYGNAPFQGETLNGQDLAFQTVSTRQLQLGYANALGERNQFRWGVVVNGIQGINSQIFQVNDVSVYTGPDGDSVRLAVNYDEFSGQSGWGISATVGVEYEITPMLRVQAAAGNIGAIWWSGNGRSVDASFGTAGLDGGPLFQDILPLNDSLFRLDTLNQLFLPGKTSENFRQSLLPRGHIGAAVKVQHWEFMGNVLFQQWLDGRVIPGASLSAMYGFRNQTTPESPFLRLGANLSINQWQQLGLGAVARGFIRLGEGQYLTLYAMADQLQAWLTPTTGTAGSVRAGIMYVFF